MPRHITSSTIDLRIIRRLLGLAGLELVRDTSFTEMMKHAAQVTNRPTTQWAVIAPREGRPPVLIGMYSQIRGILVAMQKYWREWGFSSKPPTMEQVSYVLIDSQWKFLCSEAGEATVDAMGVSLNDLEFVRDSLKTGVSESEECPA